MNANKQILEQVLALSESMHGFATSGHWELLVEADNQRAELVAQLCPDDNTGNYSAEKDRISALQNEIISLVLAERERVDKEYLQVKGKLSVSSSYLENMESTLT